MRRYAGSTGRTAQGTANPTFPPRCVLRGGWSPAGGSEGRLAAIQGTDLEPKWC